MKLIDKKKIKNICKVCDVIKEDENLTVADVLQLFVDRMHFAITLKSEQDSSTGVISYHFEIGIPFKIEEHIEKVSELVDYVVPTKYGMTYIYSQDEDVTYCMEDAFERILICIDKNLNNMTLL